MGVRIAPAVRGSRYPNFLIAGTSHKIGYILEMQSRSYPFSPFPYGWFCVGFEGDVPLGTFQRRQLFGRQLTLFHSDLGLGLFDPTCPHRTEASMAHCPVHGVAFDAPSETPSCIVPLQRKNGLLMAYHGDNPTWKIPELATAGWSHLYSTCLRLHSHPQETSENSVDLGHFTIVHGYSDPKMVGELNVDGPHLSATYSFSRHPGALRVLGTKIDVVFHADLYGLGYSLVVAEAANMGLRMRYFVLPTPTDGQSIELRLAFSLENPHFEQLSGPMRLLPIALMRKLIAPIIFREFRYDVSRDFNIWENKIFIERPALAQGDGPIPHYRKWCRQFYAS